MHDTPEVLFVCVHNAGRSQMAAALLDHHAAGRVRMSIIRSAGVSRAASAAARASGPRPMVIETAVMISCALLAGQGLAGRGGAFVPGIVCTFLWRAAIAGPPG